MKKQFQYRLVGILVIACVALHGAFFLYQVITLAQLNRMSTQNAELDMENLQYIHTVQNKAAEMDEAVQSLLGTDSSEQAKERIQQLAADFEQDVTEIMRRSSNLDSSAETWKESQSLLERGNTIVWYLENDISVPDQVIADYFGTSLRCTNALQLLSDQSVKKGLARHDEMSGQVSSAVQRVVVSFILFIVAVFICVIVFNKVKHVLWPDSKALEKAADCKGA